MKGAVGNAGRRPGTVIVLGLNAFGHDAAAVLLVDGQVVFASSQERFDRARHSPAFPREAMGAALAHAGLQARDVDFVAFPWTRGMGRLPKAWHMLRRLPRSLAYLREPPDSLLPDRRGYLRAMAGLGQRLREEGFSAPLRRVSHHRAHAASAALALPQGEGAILTADGMGEWTTAAAWRSGSAGLERLTRAVYPHSPGKAYAAVTAWLGFRPESGEGKTMGLAAYGDPQAAGAAFSRSLLAPDKRNMLRLALEAFGFPWGEARLYGDAFLESLGPARSAKREPRPGDADVALGIQQAVEGFAVDAARRLLSKTGAVHLGLAGGLFLNCALNGHLLRTLEVPVRPFPVSGDAGAAWGAAAEVHRLETGTRAAPLGTLRLGQHLDATSCEVAATPLGGTYHPEPEKLAEAVAARIASGEIVAVARGRAEFGPRALGGRSILASPRTRASRDRVNAKKGREAWRPVAPIVLEEDKTWFHDLVPSPHMILTFRATPRAREEITGVMHEDGTARVQTVGAQDDPFLRALLQALARRGEPPVVINTSLNRPGEPIVNTAEEAVTASRAMGLDALVLGGWLSGLA